MRCIRIGSQQMTTKWTEGIYLLPEDVGKADSNSGTGRADRVAKRHTAAVDVKAIK